MNSKRHLRCFFAASLETAEHKFVLFLQVLAKEHDGKGSVSTVELHRILVDMKLKDGLTLEEVPPRVPPFEFRNLNTFLLK